MTQPSLFPDPLEVAFREFHRENPSVYRLFCRFAGDVLAAGRTYYSADAIVHRIRWHTNIETRSEDGFRINDHHVTFYARMWMRDHPQHEGFFRTRRRKT